MRHWIQSLQLGDSDSLVVSVLILLIPLNVIVPFDNNSYGVQKQQTPTGVRLENEDRKLSLSFQIYRIEIAIGQLTKVVEVACS